MTGRYGAYGGVESGWKPGAGEILALQHTVDTGCHSFTRHWLTKIISHCMVSLIMIDTVGDSGVVHSYEPCCR